MNVAQAENDGAKSGEKENPVNHGETSAHSGERS